MTKLSQPRALMAARGAPRLLVLGGSLGAQALNQTLPRALLLLPSQARPLVRHQTGTQRAAACELAYQGAA